MDVLKTCKLTDAELNKLQEEGNIPYYQTVNWDMDNRESFDEYHKADPWIIFNGGTTGGDVGATLWIHRTKNKAVDSLIIDNRVFS